MNALQAGYVAMFALTAVVCVALAPRARSISDRDTRLSLAALLVVSGVWALLTVGQLLAPTEDLMVGFYTVGLVVGLATVGAWLAFASAYTGHEFHRDRRLQAVVVVGYLAAVAVKVTNPIHGQYFAADLVASPFPHLVVDRLPLDWGVTLLAYAASFAGFVLLYRLFAASDYRLEPLALLLLLTALPVIPTVVPRPADSLLLTLNYEPLGVAVFAVGVLVLADETFTSVGHFGRIHLMDAVTDPVVVLDTDGRVRRANGAATAAFPSLREHGRGRLADLVPELAASTGDCPVAVSGDDSSAYFVVKRDPLRVGVVDIGTVVVATDVTEMERHRRELERQNRQLDDFAAAIDHELRNAAAIVAGHGSLAASRAAHPVAVDRSLDAVERGAERIVEVVEDLGTLARFGQTLAGTCPCLLATWASRAAAETPGLAVTVDRHTAVVADPVRLAELFAAAFEFAQENGATTVDVAAVPDGFDLTDDGRPIPREALDDAFEYGWATPGTDTRLRLPLVRTLATVHGWVVDVDPDYDCGVRLRVRGVEYAETASVGQAVVAADEAGSP
jgi:signal transduction histidine kinase